MSTFSILIISASFLAAYLIGSIPFGLILGKVFGVGDIRNIGSGNIGATNMLRTGRKGLALVRSRRWIFIADGARAAASLPVRSQAAPLQCKIAHGGGIDAGRPRA